MTNPDEATCALLREQFDARFGCDASASDVADAPFVYASAPGRVELAGNHTDHQGGRTISAAIAQRTHALAHANATRDICVAMEGFGEARLSCDDLAPREEEFGTSASLIRGMAAAYVRGGGTLGGFDMVVRSDIPAGAGLSSSAAFEMLIGAALHGLFDDEGAPELDRRALALEGMVAECDWFGKPCGAQDQLASAFGGVCALDFADELPRVGHIELATDALPIAFVLIDSRCDHSLHTDEFAAIPTDMCAVAQAFGASRLGEVPYATFLAALPRLRGELGDRLCLRALHFYEETRRVGAQQDALRRGDFDTFLALVRQSGASSAQFLQNVSPRSLDAKTDEPATMLLALCAHLIDGQPDVGDASDPESGANNSGAHGPFGPGAYRIHGGGFGGSVLAIVPREKAADFMDAMNALVGYDACIPVELSPRGASATRLNS